MNDLWRKYDEVALVLENDSGFHRWCGKHIDYCNLITFRKCAAMFYPSVTHLTVGQGEDLFKYLNNRWGKNGEFAINPSKANP